jgi:hypothetical protein
MANTSLSLTALDFDSLKANFKNYLTSQSIFKDYNFEGSNMNVLLDVMSYNTHLNAFYLNMLASEMFLDSAQKYDSVVSHAKELNYVPKSAKSSSATVSINVEYDGGSPLSILKGTRFTGQNSNGSFTFTTDTNQNFVSANNTYSNCVLKIYEGDYFNDTFVMDYTQTSQKFILSNPNIDTDSLSITVIENGVNTHFTPTVSLFETTSSSNVYFLQAAQKGQYEIVFGDGLLGRIPNNLATIVANYRITNGDRSLGISKFVLSSAIGNPRTVVGPTTTITSAIGGLPVEGIESIRKLAPKSFSTQQRAVASDDYSSLILDQFRGQVEAVNVYGGELLNPKQYGRVAVCIKPSGGTIAPNYIKNQVSLYLQKYIALPTRVIITDPDYLYIGINSEVQYNVTGTTKYAYQIEGLINDTIKQYSKAHLETFQGDFRYSQFVAHIDETDTSITSNNTKIVMIKRITPLLNYASSFVLDYNNPTEAEGSASDNNISAGSFITGVTYIIVTVGTTNYRLIGADSNTVGTIFTATGPGAGTGTASVYNSGISKSGYTKGVRFYDEPMVTSSAFTYVDSKGAKYENCYMRDDNYGIIVVYQIIDSKFIIIQDAIGSIDYNLGIVTLTNFVTSYYGNYIAIQVEPKNKDIIVSRDKILLIDLADVNINMIPTQK